MPRPTVRDVAEAAGVSLATVDRVLNGRTGVHKTTRLRVHAAMEKLNFERDIAAANLSRRREYRMLFVLPDGPNTFMRALENEVEAFRAEAARSRVLLRVILVPPFDGAALAAALDAVSPEDTDAVALVATESPLVRDAIIRLRQSGIHVVTLVSDLPAAPRQHFVGIDNVAAGRTAAGLLGRFCGCEPGRIAVIVGSMLVRDHVERHLGFDQVMRADYPHLTLLPAIEGRDDADRVEALLGEALQRTPDVVGIYNLGAGNRGLVRAATAAGFARRPVIVVHEATVYARQALKDGIFDAAINQDIGHEVRSAVRVLRTLADGMPLDPLQERIRVDIFMRDNLP